MLARERDLLAKKASRTKRNPEDEQAGSSSSRVTSTTRGQKRQLLQNHDGREGSEYLRKKHAFIKSSIRIDHQPDVCKDYKETGFCGFGDSCKFLHDRTDYKHGWQLEQEHAKGLKEEDDKTYLIEEQDEDDNETPTKCPICEEDFKDPIVTKCKHHFCGDCAEKQCSENCYTCERPTNGIFKMAKLG